MDRGASIEVSDQALVRAVADELVIMDLASEAYFTLNETGRTVWQVSAEGGTLGDAMEQIEREYDVESAVVERDVLAVVAALIEAGLATPRG